MKVLLLLLVSCLFIGAYGANSTVVVGWNNTYTFTPQWVYISQGDSVTWVWDVNNNRTHNVWSSYIGTNCTRNTAGPLNSTSQIHGDNYTYTFNNAGVYPYFCGIGMHCAFGMYGKVIVEAVINVAPGGALSFSPSNPTYVIGTPVRWNWQSNGHTLVSGNASCIRNTSGPLNVVNIQNAGYSFAYNFTDVGVYPYFCSIHCGGGMVGTVNITAPPPIPATTTSTTGGATTGGASTGSSSVPTTTHNTTTTSAGLSISPPLYGMLVAIAGLLAVFI